jgi:diguanylate cyclase (GGDEF)-like protein/putative nucleotidyltransferase with HDIG domain
VKKLDFSEYNPLTKTIWFTLLILGVISFVFASIGLLSFGGLQFLSFVIAAVIVFILSQMQIKIPHTQYIFWFKELAVFFGVIWFGVTGAVIFSFIATIACWQFIHSNKKIRIFVLTSNIFTSFLSSTFFYFCLNMFAGFEKAVVAENPLGKKYLILASVLTCLLYYGANSLLFVVFLSLVQNKTIYSVWQTNIKYRFISYAGGLFLALLIYFSLANFGVSFGLAFLPISLVTYLIYHFQVQTLSKKTNEITEASRIHLATVEVLATAIDARDQISEGHARRVQSFSVGMGEVLGLADEEIKALRTGALLHDIGKLAVPDHILNKSSELTAAEMEKMKIHPTVGASILEKVNFDYPVIPTVRHHHENWDGTGYPSKLKGEKIPVTARILAIADAYDTLRSKRTYGKSVSREEARNILRDAAGTKFDPKLVDVFLRNLRNFEAELEAQELNYGLEIESEDESVTLIPTQQPTGRLKQGYVEQIKNANKEVFTLYELARVFSSSLNLQQTIELFAKKLGELIPFDTCAVYILDESNSYAVAKHIEGENASIIKGKHLRLNEGATGYVLQNRVPVYQVSPALDFAFYETDVASDYISMVSLPLLAENRLVGAISLYSSELENYEEEHLRLLETVSKIAADAISKSISHAETENRSLTDPMTGLPNARSLQAQFEIETARAYRSRHGFQLLMIDLDGFKKVNDTFGHKVGDAVLREVSKVMRSQLRDYDFLARYAGDEFVAILPETTSIEIQELVQRIEIAVKAFALPVGEDRFAQVGASIGSASYPQNGETLDQVLIAADSAMYLIKALHKQKDEVAKQKPKLIITEVPKPATIEIENSMLIVELDESHIVSNSLH